VKSNNQLSYLGLAYKELKECPTDRKMLQLVMRAGYKIMANSKALYPDVAKSNMQRTQIHNCTEQTFLQAN